MSLQTDALREFTIHAARIIDLHATMTENIAADARETRGSAARAMWMVWRAFECDEGAGTHLAAIPRLPVGSENLVFPAGARISMQKRCTGHMMAAVSWREWRDL